LEKYRKKRTSQCHTENKERIVKAVREKVQLTKAKISELY
jgi:hypothetical protein